MNYLEMSYAYLHSNLIKSIKFSESSRVGEWVIKFKGLSVDNEQRGPYKPCNCSLYIGIIIFPHIDNTQSTGFKEMILEMKHKKSEDTH